MVHSLKPQGTSAVPWVRKFLPAIYQELQLGDAPLTALTSLSVPFRWSSVAERAFGELWERFTSAPILVFPDPGRQLIVEVDASDTGVGAVFSQRSVKDPQTVSGGEKL